MLDTPGAQQASSGWLVSDQTGRFRLECAQQWRILFCVVLKKLEHLLLQLPIVAAFAAQKCCPLRAGHLNGGVKKLVDTRPAAGRYWLPHLKNLSLPMSRRFLLLYA